jgi:hypothetical protein
VLGTNAARFGDPLFEPLAGAEDSDRRIAGRQALLRSEHLHWLAADLDRRLQWGIFGTTWRNSAGPSVRRQRTAENVSIF